MSIRTLPRKRGFTLVELLVVIGIIALLISMLLPALNQVRKQAESTQCLAQLRQCGQALYLYANSNKGYLPQGVVDSVDKFPVGGSSLPAPLTFLKYYDTASALNRIVQPQGADLRLPNGPPPQSMANPAWSVGGMRIFFCPSNYIFDDQARGSASSRWPEDFAAQTRIRYNYLGNPNPYYPLYHWAGPYPQASAQNQTLDWRYWDRNGNGTNRDEYMIKIGDKNTANITIMVDSIRFLNSPNTNLYGIAMTHGKGKSPLSGWLNELYGDGHADSKRPRLGSWSMDGKKFINPTPGPDELQPSWGNSSATGQQIIW